MKGTVLFPIVRIEGRSAAHVAPEPETREERGPMLFDYGEFLKGIDREAYH